MLFEKRGLIRDRSKGFRELSYYLPRESRAFMRGCLKAHELMVSVMDSKDRAMLTNKSMKANVLRYMALDSDGKREFVRRLILKDCFGSHPPRKAMPLEELADAWLELKLSEGAGEGLRKTLCRKRGMILRFFKESGLADTDDLDYGTASKFLRWRAGTSLHPRMKTPTSASTMKYEIAILRQMARIACRSGCLPNGDIWDDVRVKAIAGVNKKVVEPLSVELQKELLGRLRNTPYLDIALLLLITGMRIGEMKALKPGGIRNGMLNLHGESIGFGKPAGGKTASASRILPSCPTLLKLFERGNIFNVTANAFALALKRHCKEVHAHRLRHTFAVNNLLARVPLQMVSYQMGHSATGITSDLYGKFVPEHFKAGFEETIRIRKEHLDWLENRYEF